MSKLDSSLKLSPKELQSFKFCLQFLYCFIFLLKICRFFLYLSLCIFQILKYYRTSAKSHSLPFFEIDHHYVGFFFFENWSSKLGFSLGRYIKWCANIMFGDLYYRRKMKQIEITWVISCIDYIHSWKVPQSRSIQHVDGWFHLHILIYLYPF